MSFPTSCIFAFSLSSAAACAFNGSNDPSNGGSAIDAASIDATDDPDGMTDDDAGLSEAPHLLISEIRNRDSGREFIEIYNPGDSAVSLDNYYLADNGAYINLSVAVLTPDAFRLAQGADFVVRFPPNNTIMSKGVVVVGIGLKVIADVPPITAQFHIVADNAVAMGVEMLTAYPGSIRGVPTLTNPGEGVILFYWDGISNLVSDVDIVVAGNNPESDNLPPNKTGQLVVGTSSTYAPDLGLFPPSSDILRDEESYQRIALENDSETQDGNGNGITGHDETSEDTTITWEIQTMTPGTTNL